MRSSLSIDLGEVAVRSLPTYIRTHLHSKTHRPPDRQWAPSKTGLERPQWRARCALPQLSGWETVSTISVESAVPYGRYKNLLLITRPKEHFPPLASNAKTNAIQKTIPLNYNCKNHQNRKLNWTAFPRSTPVEEYFSLGRVINSYFYSVRKGPRPRSQFYLKNLGFLRVQVIVGVFVFLEVSCGIIDCAGWAFTSDAGYAGAQRETKIKEKKIRTRWEVSLTKT